MHYQSGCCACATGERIVSALGDTHVEVEHGATEAEVPVSIVSGRC